MSRNTYAALVAAAAATLPPAAPARAGDVQVYETTADATMLVARQPDVAFGAPAHADATVTVSTRPPRSW